MNVGCFGGGTGLPSLLGGLKNNPWVHTDAVVTMFDSGGSSGVLRDELGVLPPGDILKCALVAGAQYPRGAARAARASADARACPPRRPYRRQPSAFDDAAVQRRFSGRHRRPARVAWVHGTGVAGRGGAGIRLRRVRGRLDDARRSGSGRGTVVRAIRAAHLAGAAGLHPPGGRGGHRASSMP